MISTVISPFLRVRFYPPYRIGGVDTLTGLPWALAGLFILSSFCPGIAAEDDWPSPIDFPPASFAAPRPTVPPAEAKKKEGGGKFRLFGRGKRAKPSEAAPSGTVSNKGKPQEVPPRPFPLLRLATAIQTGDGVLPAGLYLAVPAPTPPAPPASADESGKAPETTGKKVSTDPNHRTITLLQRNQPHLTLSLTRFTGTDDNQRLYGTASPLEKIDPKTPPVQRMEARLGPDGRSVTFIWREEEARFDSAPFPVVIDTRPMLRF
jgi:hypothetical protein